MKKIIIADSSKVSLMMISEVFKDYYQGIQVIVATNSPDTLRLSKQHEKVDAYIVDLDLTDGQAVPTALKLKESSKTPVLITAFDNPEVHQIMKTNFAKYSDCQNWLKKPIVSDVVIAVAQYFCEGQRTQKRIACNIPAFAELVLKPHKSEKKGVRGKKQDKTTKQDSKTITSLSLYGVIEDCSINGVRLKPRKYEHEDMKAWNEMLANMELMVPGTPVTLTLSSFSNIETGNSSKIFTKLDSLSEINLLKKDKKSDFEFQSLNGKVVWANSESGEWEIGVEFDNQVVSKGLFEAVVASKSKRNLQNQSMLKTLKYGTTFQGKKRIES